jgi:hypothetical protein
MVVIAAVERYAFVSPVPGALDNANSWYDYFTKTLGMPPERVLLLKDGDVTREELLSSLEKSAANAPKGGSFWFVFIGHGAPGPKGQEGFLVGVDAQQKASSLYSRSISEAEIHQALNTAPSGRINVILDACFSGRDNSGNALVAGLQPLLLRVAPAADPRWVVLTAARADQFAGPLPGAQRPAFSYLTLGALRGWANPGKAVTAGDIFGYTKRVLGLLVRGRQQEPTLQGNPNSTLAPLANEAGPDLTELQKVLSGNDSEIHFETLPAVATPKAPEALTNTTVGVDWGKLDVAELEAYNEVVAFEKQPASATEKAAHWQDYGKKHKAQAKMSEERSRSWQVYAKQVELAQRATSERAKAQRQDWKKLSRLLKLDVVTPQQKSEWILNFAESYGWQNLSGELTSQFADLKPLMDSAAQEEAACNTGNTKACLKAGFILAFGPAPGKHQASNLLAKACDAGDGLGCTYLAFSYDMGEGVSKDIAKAVDLYRKACDIEDSGGCYWLGYAYANGVGLRKDEIQAARLFRKACDMGEPSGCSLIGYAYAIGAGLRKDEIQAAELYRKACDMGGGLGCSNLGNAYSRGNGVNKDDAKAAEYYRRACDIGDGPSCLGLGLAYAKGQGVIKDRAKSSELYRKACVMGDGRGCTRLGWAYLAGGGVSRDLAKAVELFQKSCDMGDGAGCEALGSDYERGEGVSKDLAKAAELYRKACGMGDGGGCLSLGFAYNLGNGVSEDDAKATELYEKSCDMGDGLGCYSAAGMYREGAGVSKDIYKTAELYRKGCDLGVGLSCSALAAAYQHGTGVSRNLAKAAEYERKACHAGIDPDCHK